MNNLAEVVYEEPSDIELKSKIAVDTADVLTAVKDALSAWQHSPTFDVPLFELNNVLLIIPLMVKVHREGMWFFAENESLVITGIGNNPFEAVVDFKEHLLHLYNHYKNLSEDELTGDAVRLKRLFEGLISED